MGKAVIDEKGRRYESLRDAFLRIGGYAPCGAKYRDLEREGKVRLGDHTLTREDYKDMFNNEEYNEFLECKKTGSVEFRSYDFDFPRKDSGYKYAIALFSDAHIEEVVKSESVLGLNEYNIDIARDRIGHYFANLCSCIVKDKVNELIFASLGDTISGYIHDELAQTNSLSPLEAVMEAQSLILSGLKYIVSHTDLKKIRFIGIVGNHSRTTKKIQHSNGYRLSYEWMMYKNIERECKKEGLPVEFYIPDSEMAVVNTADGRRFIFVHGYQIRGTGTGTVCGIFPALNRLAMKWDKTFKQDKIFLGHFHSCTSIPSAMVNGSLIGFNAYSLSNGFTFEEPAQMYVVYDDTIGEELTRKIYCK